MHSSTGMSCCDVLRGKNKSDGIVAHLVPCLHLRYRARGVVLHGEVGLSTGCVCGLNRVDSYPCNTDIEPSKEK